MIIPDPNGIDIVIPLGRGSQFKNLELRYCLRSLEKHARGVRRIVIVGEKPKYLSNQAVHFFCPHFECNKDARISLKVAWAFENCDLTEEVLFANDDFVFLKDFDAREVPYYQRGQLNPEKLSTIYHRVLRETHDELAKAKKPTLNYDLHHPIRFRRAEYLKLRPWWELSSKSKVGFAQKSIYSNLTLRKPGPRLDDCKFQTYKGETEALAKIEGRDVFSYGDQPLYESFELFLYKLFPQQSRFETA